MRHLIISTSLNPESLSRVMARAVYETLQAQGASVAWLDLRELALPLCDAGGCYADPNVAVARAAVRDADGIVLASSIYNYDLNAAAKNLVELTGDAWTEKVVGFLCAAGGKGSYMSVMGLANSLMLDFRAMILPRFVYATGEDFDDDGALREPRVEARLRDLARELVRVTRALRGAQG